MKNHTLLLLSFCSALAISVRADNEFPATGDVVIKQATPPSGTAAPIRLDLLGIAPSALSLSYDASGSTPGIATLSISDSQGEWRWEIAADATTDRRQMTLGPNNVLTLFTVPAGAAAPGPAIVLDPAGAGTITINGSPVLTQADLAVDASHQLTVAGDIRAGGKLVLNGVPMLSNAGGLGSIHLGETRNQTSTGTGNVFAGHLAGASNTTGSYNNFMGLHAGVQNTTGEFNNFLGFQAGYHNGSGSYNNFMGYRAGEANTTGSFNTFTGYLSGFQNTSGSGNVFIGQLTGAGNTTGSGNVAIGFQAGVSNTTASHNIFLGQGTGYFNQTGWANHFLGWLAGVNNISGGENNLSGPHAGYHNIIGSRNLFMGNSAGYQNQSGSDNIFLGGYYTGGSNVSGSENIFLGLSAGSSNTTGSFNTFLGISAGGRNTTGFYNIYLGAYADDFSSGASSNQLIVGGQADGNTNGFISQGYFGSGKVAPTPVSFTMNATGGQGSNQGGADLHFAGGKGTGTGTGGAITLATAPASAVTASTPNALIERMRITADGKVGIGTSTPHADPRVKLDVAGVVRVLPGGDIPMF